MQRCANAAAVTQASSYHALANLQWQVKRCASPFLGRECSFSPPRQTRGRGTSITSLPLSRSQSCCRVGSRSTSLRDRQKLPRSSKYVVAAQEAQSDMVCSFAVETLRQGPLSKGKRRAGGSPFSDGGRCASQELGFAGKGEGGLGLALCERSKMVAQRQHPWDSGTMDCVGASLRPDCCRTRGPSKDLMPAQI